MHLREGEHILQVYRHHPTPFIYRIVKVIIGSFPFFMMLFLLQSAFSQKTYIILHLIVFGLFILVTIYVSLIYWLDKFVVTNQRIVHEDWKYLTVRNETEVMFGEISDIQTAEKGIWAALKVFDYGTITVNTPSSYVTLVFFDAPDPEGMRKFIYHVKNVQ